jgi:hypothetical protein
MSITAKIHHGSVTLPPDLNIPDGMEVEIVIPARTLRNGTRGHPVCLPVFNGGGLQPGVNLDDSRAIAGCQHSRLCQREDLPAHVGAKSWLESALNGGEPVGLFDPTLASFLRIVTNRRIFKIPTPLPVALTFIETLRAAPAARPLNAGTNFWEILARLCRDTNAAGDDIPDVCLAALAIENNCEFISTDGDFARFPGLKWRRPF